MAVGRRGELGCCITKTAGTILCEGLEATIFKMSQCGLLVPRPLPSAER